MCCAPCRLNEASSMPSSGYSVMPALSSAISVSLDRAAERAVSDAAPLPWVYGEVTVPVRFALRDPD